MSNLKNSPNEELLIQKWPVSPATSQGKPQGPAEEMELIKKTAKLTYKAALFFLEFPAKVTSTSIMSFITVLQQGVE